jgi:molecular chaperone DnaK (HSP70)
VAEPLDDKHVSALILRKVVHDAQLLAGPVTQAAITVPAYFSDPMRAATLRVGELTANDVFCSRCGTRVRTER